MSRFRLLELYCGIGGCAAALGDTSAARVVAAVDVNRVALSVYRHNFPHPARASLVESVPADQLRQWDADLWWMSPPCQPFTRRGLRRDLDDPRAETLLAVLDRVTEVRPTYLGFENVPGFQGSGGHRRLLATLERAGYRSIVERLLCPTDFGIPNRRRRYYLVASRGSLLTPPPRPRPAGVKLAPHEPGPAAQVHGPTHPYSNAGPRDPSLRLGSSAGLLDRYLDPEPDPTLEVAPELLEPFRGVHDVLRADEPAAVTSCFTSAYGRSIVRSGSYLATRRGLRRFSPTEILRLLGFPAGYRLPADLPLKNAWRLAGNSLSVTVMRAVLSTVPELAGLRP